MCHGQPVESADREAVWRNSLQPYFDEYEVTDIPSGPGREPFNHQLADVIEPYKPPVISFHFGLPDRDLLDRVKSWGATVLASATTVAQAQWLEQHGADGVMHTAITNLFSGRPARSVVNRAVRELGPMSSNTPAFPLASVAITALRKKAESKGVGDFSPLWCGQNASGCKEISAAELTRQLADIG